MIVFLALLLLALLAVGLYAAQNTGTHDVTLWHAHWTGVADWVPVVMAAGLVAVLFLVYMLYAGARSGMRHGALRRRITTHEATISDLRTQTQRLREENARLKSEARSAQLAGPRVEAEQGAPPMEPVGVRQAPANTPEPSLGERVRSFLNGREPADS
ncbi:MAG TPA: hypothetical protein VET82_01580 [Candidatus Eisenbacteria bacterium]|nr:hypothetical protein [Candidatus Eisenbacteria bacterium]